MKAMFRMWSVTDIEMISLECLLKKAMITGDKLLVQTLLSCGPGHKLPETNYW